MQQKISFSRGIDSDNSPQEFKDGFGRSRLNVRVMTTDNGEMESAENVKGNILVPFTLPTGNNTCIGSYEDQLQKKVYAFIYNDQSNHSILEYDQVTNTIAKVFQSAILNFSLSFLITGINVVKLTDTAHLLYWNDNNNQPRKINIEKGKLFMQGNYSNGYKFPFDPLIINRIKQPPLFPPVYTWSRTGQSSPLSVNASASSFALDSTLTPQVIPFTSVSNPNFNNSTHSFVATQGGVFNPSINGVATTTVVDFYLFVNGVLQETIFSSNFTFGILFAPVTLSAGGTIDVRATGIMVGQSPTPTITTSNLSIQQAVNADNNVNFLLNKMYTFKYKYIYDDYEQSRFSPISKYVMPSVNMDYVTGDNVITQDNKITISLNSGISIVKKIVIAAKELNETAFTIIGTIDKEQLGLIDNQICFYDFYGNNLTIPIATNDDIALYDFVPLKAQSQEIINNSRVVDGLITEGFDPVNIDIRILTFYDQVSVWSNTDNFPKISYLKSGGEYVFGIVYYNESNQSGVTNVNDWKADIIQNGKYGTHLFIPFLTQPNYSGHDMRVVPQIEIIINNRAPSWATHYQIVRTKNLAYSKYLQFCSGEIKYIDGATGLPTTRLLATKLTVNLANLNGPGFDSYSTQNPNSFLVYDFTKGDRIRFIANRALSTIYDTANFLDYNDTIIDSYDASTGILTITIPSATNVDLAPLRNLSDGCLFEIYHPGISVPSDKVPTYEIGECYKVIRDSFGNYVHEGTNSIQSFDAAGNLVTPAQIFISGGDTFRRRQRMPFQTGQILDVFVESENVNNMYHSKASNEGRPNRIDPEWKQITRPSTIYYSEQLVPETFINGLSTVYDTNFESYNQNYGGIYKMFSTSDYLLMFQELKNARIPVGRILYQGQTGETTVGLSDDVLSKQAEYDINELGIGKHPESFAYYDNSKYGIDVRRGVVWRRAQDGITPISEYFQHIYFTALCKQILQSSQKVNIYGIYDKRFGEYVLAISGFTYNGITVLPQTIAFNERDNLWSTNYSIFPENMVTNGVNYIAFKNGALWKQNENPIYNNFFGVQYPSELEFYCNGLSSDARVASLNSNIKVYEAISLESNAPMDVVVETPITAENPNGQHTELIASNFQMKEGFFYSQLLNDDFTPNTVTGAPYLPNARFEGRPMRGAYASIKLSSNSTNYLKIYKCNIQFSLSERSNQ